MGNGESGAKQSAEERRRAERRRGADRRGSASERRAGASGLRSVDQFAESDVHVLTLAAAVILAPRLQALEFRDTMGIRKLIHEAVNLSRLILQKAEVEHARDFVEEESARKRNLQ